MLTSSSVDGVSKEKENEGKTCCSHGMHNRDSPFTASLFFFFLLRQGTYAIEQTAVCAVLALAHPQSKIKKRNELWLTVVPFWPARVASFLRKKVKAGNTKKKKRKRRGFKHLLYLDFFPLLFISRFFFFSWWDGALCIRPFFFFAFLLLKRTCEFYAASFFLFFFVTA